MQDMKKKEYIISVEILFLVSGGCQSQLIAKLASVEPGSSS
jgi:hypothetical protein